MVYISPTLQTILVILAPFILPRILSIAVSLLRPSPPPGQRTPLNHRPPPPPPPTSLFRLLLLSIFFSHSLFSALAPPANIFLDLSPPQTLLTRVFPILRQPLDLRLPTETLAKKLATRNPGKPLSDSQLHLLQVLQTLDARVTYAAYGAQPLLNCSWCSPVHPQDAWFYTDYAMERLPGVALQYLVVLGAAVALVRGTRRKWRIWVIIGVLGEAAWEFYTRVKWQGNRGGAIVMIHTQLHVIRHLYFAFLLLLAYLSPPKPPPQHPTTSSFIAPPLVELINRAEANLQRLRAVGIMRMAVLRDSELREKVTNFWSAAEEESVIAAQDAGVKALREKTGGSEEDKHEFRAWMDAALRPRGPPGAPGVGGPPSRSRPPSPPVVQGGDAD